jgi:rhodanese-related sulfurtransferase
MKDEQERMEEIMMVKRHLAAMIFCAALGVISARAAEHTSDSLEKVKQNVAAKKALILDVREQSEWEEGHLAGAKLVPLSKLRAGRSSKEYVEQLAKEAPQEKIIYCHCRAGVRALTAGDILKELGYDVRPLKQGYEELIEAGFPKAK